MYEKEKTGNDAVSPMQKTNFKYFTILSEMWLQYWEMGKRYFYNLYLPTDTIVEAPHRRHDERRSVDDFIKRVWDAVQKPPSMARLLHKQSTRESKDEAVQRKQEEVGRRAIRIANLSKTEGWKEIIILLQSWENFCYMNLRFPESRKDKVSTDYYTGYQNGALWVIEGLRKEIYGAVYTAKKEHILQKKDNK